MRALTMEELEWVSGSGNPSETVVVTGSHVSAPDNNGNSLANFFDFIFTPKTKSSKDADGKGNDKVTELKRDLCKAAGARAGQVVGKVVGGVAGGILGADIGGLGVFVSVPETVGGVLIVSPEIVAGAAAAGKTIGQYVGQGVGGLAGYSIATFTCPG